jgi:hypothetical protein
MTLPDAQQVTALLRRTRMRVGNEAALQQSIEEARYGKRAIYRQLERYAAQPQIAALILVTGTAMGLPAAIGGKPVFIVSTGRASL